MRRRPRSRAAPAASRTPTRIHFSWLYLVPPDGRRTASGAGELMVTSDLVRGEGMIVEGQLVQPADEGAAVFLVERIRRLPSHHQATWRARPDHRLGRQATRHPVVVEFHPAVVHLGHDVMPAPRGI